jgi:hypothetical protein
MCSFYFGKELIKVNKLKKIILSFLFSIACLVGITSVYAGTNDSNLVRNKYDGYMAVYDGSDRVHLYYAERYTLNGVTAYCMEVGVSIDTNTYSSTNDWNVTGLSTDVKNYIRLVAYYGYEYQGHNTMKYYMAAQEIIWEKISGRSIYWVQGTSASSPEVDVSVEKNNILNLVNAHTKVPSFDEKTIEVNVGESKTITDTNGVLSNYQIYHSDLKNVSINGNSMTITGADSRSDKQIQLIKKNYTTVVNFIYYSGNSQKLISSGVLDPVVSVLNVKSTGGTITPNKLDKETLETPQGDATLKGAKYGIYNSKNELVDTIITGEKETTKDIPYGNYTIKEIEASEGYELDPTTYQVTIDSTNQDITLNVYENVIKRKVNFFKVFATDKTSLLVGEPNVQFDIYLKSSNELYKSITTDDEGYAQVVLPYGTYVCKQVTATKDYEKVKDFEIVIKESREEPINKLISNAEITARLKVIKIDSESGKIIKRDHIKFKIKNLQTNEYVCQRITYPTKQDICEFETTDGEFITPFPLNSGKYKLEEIDQVVDGYVWNNESLEFEIGENSQLINDEELGIIFEVKFENKRVKGNIEIQKYGQEFKVEDGTYKYVKNNLANIEFGIYAKEDIIIPTGEVIYKKDELVTTIKTNSDGKAIAKNIDLGNYYIKELSTLDDYVLDTNSYDITLSYKDQYTEIVTEAMEIQNYLKKGKLVFNKTDISTSEPLPNTKIEIYTEDDELIYTGITDENGQVVIDDLPIGRFYILEKEAPEGYKLNDEKMYFEIRENGEIVKCTMVDEKIEIEVPNTGLKGIDTVKPISFILLALGIGVVIYATKKNQK